MTPYLRFDTAQLLRHSEEIKRITADIENGVEDLVPGVRRLAEEWEGVAGEGFQLRIALWQQAQESLLGNLRALRAVLDGAAENYEAAESANTQTWSGQ